MTQSEEDIRRRELPINRAIHKLHRGARAEDITAASIGVPESDRVEIVRSAQRRMRAVDEEYAAMTRRGATGYILFGLVMLALAYFLSETDVPLLRQGRLIIGIVIGAASLVWGLIRLFKSNPGRVVSPD